jgi:hypothetical protein
MYEANTMSGDDEYVSRSALQFDRLVPITVIGRKKLATDRVIGCTPVGPNLNNDFLSTTDHHPPLVAIARARIAYALAISICVFASGDVKLPPLF